MRVQGAIKSSQVPKQVPKWSQQRAGGNAAMAVSHPVPELQSVFLLWGSADSQLAMRLRGLCWCVRISSPAWNWVPSYIYEKRIFLPHHTRPSITSDQNAIVVATARQQISTSLPRKSWHSARGYFSCSDQALLRIIAAVEVFDMYEWKICVHLWMEQQHLCIVAQGKKKRG